MGEICADIWKRENLPDSIKEVWDHDPVGHTWLDNLRGELHRLNEYINAHQLIMNQFAYHDEKYWWKGDDLGKMKEKAELWEQYAIYDNDKEAEIPVKDLLIAYEELGGYKADAERMSKKLKAIQTWYDSEEGFQTSGLVDLGKLLKGS